MESAPMQFGNWQEGSAEIRALQAENAKLRDFARNIAGLDDRLLNSTDILKQWRDDARALLSE